MAKKVYKWISGEGKYDRDWGGYGNREANCPGNQLPPVRNGTEPEQSLILEFFPHHYQKERKHKGGGFLRLAKGWPIERSILRFLENPMPRETTNKINAPWAYAECTHIQTVIKGHRDNLQISRSPKTSDSAFSLACNPFLQSCNTCPFTHKPVQIWLRGSLCQFVQSINQPINQFIA